MKQYFLAFVPIFVAVDALGMVPIFLSLTGSMTQNHRRTLVRQSVMTALLVALGFLWIGQSVFRLLGITMSDFMVAGGAVLFILSIRDLLSYSSRPVITGKTVGVVPIAVPLIVGPAVLTTSLILLSAYGFWPTFVSIVVNITLCGIILYFSGKLSKVFGETGAHTLSKIMNLLLAAIGVMLIRRGLFEILRSMHSG